MFKHSIKVKENYFSGKLSLSVFTENAFKVIIKSKYSFSLTDNDADFYMIYSRKRGRK